MLFWITLYGQYPGKNPKRFQKCMVDSKSVLGVPFLKALAFRKSYTFLGSFQKVFKAWQSQNLMSQRPLLLGSNFFSPTKADKKRSVFVKTSIKILLAAGWGFWKTNTFTGKWKNFFVERSWKSKVFYLKSILSIVSLKFLVLKKKKVIIYTVLFHPQNSPVPTTFYTIQNYLAQLYKRIIAKMSFAILPIAHCNSND